MAKEAKVAECVFEFLLHQLIASTEESTRKSGVVDEEEVKEIVALKVESMGYDVGFRFMERCAQGKLVGMTVGSGHRCYSRRSRKAQQR